MSDAISDRSATARASDDGCGDRDATVSAGCGQRVIIRSNGKRSPGRIRSSVTRNTDTFHLLTQPSNATASLGLLPCAFAAASVPVRLLLPKRRILAIEENRGKISSPM